jgi:hypothetical protein
MTLSEKVELITLILIGLGMLGMCLHAQWRGRQ